MDIQILRMGRIPKDKTTKGEALPPLTFVCSYCDCKWCVKFDEKGRTCSTEYYTCTCPTCKCSSFLPIK